MPPQAEATSTTKRDSNNDIPTNTHILPITVNEDYLAVDVFATTGAAWRDFTTRIRTELTSSRIPRDGMVVTLPGSATPLTLRRQWRGESGSYAILQINEVVIRPNLRICWDYEQYPAVRIEVPGRVCLLYGGLAACYEVMRLLTRAELYIARVHLTRVDICADLPGVHVDAFVIPIAAGCRVSRVRRVLTQPGDGGSVEVGKEPVRLCIYDKRAQLNANFEVTTLQAMQVRWGGVVPHHATRVEYRVRTEYLRDHLITTLDDYLRYRSQLIQSLMQGWFRMTEVVPVVNHTADTPIHPLWAQIRDAAIAAFGTPLPPPPVGMVRRPALPSIKTAIGYLVTAAARSGLPIESREAFLTYAYAAISSNAPIEAALINSIQTRRVGGR
jgi:hypothetical protein